MSESEKKRAFLFVADWIDDHVKSGDLDYYYWGYGQISDGLRKESELFG